MCMAILHRVVRPILDASTALADQSNEIVSTTYSAGRQTKLNLRDLILLRTFSSLYFHSICRSIDINMNFLFGWSSPFGYLTFPLTVKIK